MNTAADLSLIIRINARVLELKRLAAVTARIHARLRTAPFRARDTGRTPDTKEISLERADPTPSPLARVASRCPLLGVKTDMPFCTAQPWDMNTLTARPLQEEGNLIASS